MDAAAEAIADELLYLTGKAIMENHDDMFLCCISLPQLMETSNGRQLITTEGEIREILAGVRQYMKNKGYVDLVRTVVSARFVDADTIEATHVSLMVSEEENRKRAPYPVHSVMRRFDDRWKLISSLYAILDCQEHNNALFLSKELKSLKK